jgi:tetratricopeptide (TPR) repeat protein
MNYPVSIIIFIILISARSPIHGQTKFSQETDFVNHLFEIKEFDEAIYYLKDISSLYSTQNDSVQYLLGRSHYLKKEVGLAIPYFEKVNAKNHDLWVCSQMFSSFCNNHQKNYSSAITALENIDAQGELYKQLRHTQLAGSYLLSRQISKYDSIAPLLSRDYLSLQRTNQRLESYSHNLKNVKIKSPVLAGVFSAIIPGSGKIYAGKTGEGLSTLFLHTILGFMAKEALKKDGAQSPRFLIYGSIFSLFYVANIWSSTLSVKIYRNEYYESVHESIMVDLHIPLRTIFGSGKYEASR